MTTPLTKDERGNFDLEWIAVAETGLHRLDEESTQYAASMFRRYEATVRAVEAERDAAVARAEKLWTEAEKALAQLDLDESITDPLFRGAKAILRRALAADDAERGDG